MRQTNSGYYRCLQKEEEKLVFYLFVSLIHNSRFGTIFEKTEYFIGNQNKIFFNQIIEEIYWIFNTSNSSLN